MKAVRAAAVQLSSCSHRAARGVWTQVLDGVMWEGVREREKGRVKDGWARQAAVPCVAASRRGRWGAVCVCERVREKESE